MNGSPGRGDAGGEGAAFDTAALLGEDADAFERVLDGQSPGPLAVCSAPFGGRDQVLDHAAERLGADLLRLRPEDDDGAVRAALGDGPVVIDNCQQLYEHRIGGFDTLDTVLRALAESDDLVVMGWNNYAWTYLSHVRGIDRTFAVRAEVGPMAAGDLATLVLDRYAEIPEFGRDEADASRPFSIRRYEIGWRGRSVSVPVPVPDRAGIAASVDDGDVDPKDVVFERLAAVSEGNVGVATAIWEANRRAELRPSDVVAPGADLNLDRQEAFCLRLVLLKERVTRAELSRVIDDTERVLGRIRRDGIVSVEDGVVRLEPAAVPAAVTETERRGLL